MSRDMFSVGSPVDSNIISMLTIPACGMPAAPVLAAVTIKLGKEDNDPSLTILNYMNLCRNVKDYKPTLLEEIQITCCLSA